jgi:hypothetical protein
MEEDYQSFAKYASKILRIIDKSLRPMQDGYYEGIVRTGKFFL